MDRLMNAMKLQSAAQDATGAQPRFAVVSSIDPKTMTARVLLQPEQVLTGWIFGLLEQEDDDYERAKSFVVGTICDGLEAHASEPSA